MPRIPGVPRFLRVPWRDRRRVADDVHDELRFHLEMRTRELAEQGLSGDDAGREALRRFGDLEEARRYCEAMDVRLERQARRVDLFGGALQDARYALRQLRRAPGFAMLAVLTLALGIGAATTVAGVVDRILLRPLPFDQPESILTLRQIHEREGNIPQPAAPANFLDWRERSRTLAAIAAAESFGFDLITDDGPRSVPVQRVTRGFFEIFGVRARLGRTFLPEEYSPGHERVVILSDGMWREQFGGDSSIVGTSRRFDGEPYTIVGVMPPGFIVSEGAALWAPRVFAATERPSRAAKYYDVFARPRPGATLGDVRADLDVVAQRLAEEYPRTNANSGILVTPLQEELLRPVRPAMLILLGAAVLLLLVTCANVANLLLTRAGRRERELALRAALGAGRGRIVRQLATESLLLAVLGGAAGIVIAQWGIAAIRAAAPRTMPRVSELAMDGRVMLLGIGLAVATAVLFGLAPALRSLRADLGVAMGGGRSQVGSGERQWLRRALVAGEMAMAVLLLIGAGLLARSFVELLRVDRGYRTDGILAVTVQAWQYHPTEAHRIAFVRATVERIAALPGVHSVGVTSSLPMADAIGSDFTLYQIEGRPTTPGQESRARATVASPGYFETLGIALRSGRLFTAADDTSALPVAIVSETLAREHWPAESALGKRLVFGTGADAITREIVGVVADVRHSGPADTPLPMVYVAHAQLGTGALVFTVRTTGEPRALVGAVQEAIWASNPALPLAEVTTMDALLAEKLRERRFHLALIGGFSLVALVLTGVGIYGVLASITSERTREIGVRMALGARAGDVVMLVLKQGGLLALAGIGLGTVAGFGASRLLRGMLFGIQPIDPMTFAASMMLALVCAGLAMALPARRAARLDPTEALRAD